MTSYAQRFYPAKTRPTGSSTFYDFLETLPAADTTTNVQYTTNAQVQKRIIPFAASTATQAPPAVGGAASNIGWRFRSADSDADNGEPRVIAAGSWRPAITIQTGTYALLAANPNFTLTAVLYRIRAGVSTELGRGTASGAAAASSALTLNPTIALAAQTLLPGDLLQAEYYLTGQATQNALGQVTNQTVLVKIGDANTYLDLGNPLRTVATRSTITESTAVTDSAARTQTDFRRSTDEVQPMVDTAARQLSARRPVSDSIPMTDSAVSQEQYARVCFEVSPAALDTAARTQTAYRRVAEIDQDIVVLTTRVVATSRTAAQAVARPAEAAIKLVTYGRSVGHQFTPGDQPLLDPTRRMQGVVRNEDGTPYLGQAVVLLVRNDDVVVAETTSSPVDGSYVFLRNSYDTATYFVAAFTDDPALPREAVTERGLVPL
jgi:hypothetical protein